MDVLSDVLHSLHMRSTLYCRSELGEPWGLHFAAVEHAVFHVLHAGSGFLCLPGETALHPIAAGDVVLLPRGEEHILVSAPGAPLFQNLRLDQWGECVVMRWSTPPQAVVLCGTFDLDSQRDHPLLELLPRVLHVRSGEIPGLPAMLALLAVEAEASRPGKATVLVRLADILFVQIVRYWVETQGSHVRGWLSALADRDISQSLSLIHTRPDQSWTVAELARELAMSRSAFAARFSQIVGEPPLRYLTRWRMQVARRLLRDQQLDIQEVALRVGYDSAAAFSKAFKRELGVAPGSYRHSPRSST
jgi:AraC-like DNA-binding protein